MLFAIPWDRVAVNLAIAHLITDLIILVAHAAQSKKTVKNNLQFIAELQDA